MPRFSVSADAELKALIGDAHDVTNKNFNTLNCVTNKF